MFKTLFPLSLVFTIFFTSCQKDTTDPNPVPPPESMYFPPTSGTEWQTTTAASLGWNEALIPDLYTYLQSKGTKGFIVLKNGKIVIEKYFGTFTADSNWYWASAGKTATAVLVGIAQQEGIININNKTSQYLGTGWTSLPLAKENFNYCKASADHDNGIG